MSKHPITLTISPGRAGTQFLYNCGIDTFGAESAVSHELLDQRYSKPAIYHRCYDEKDLRRLREEKPVMEVLKRWRRQAEIGPVVDFGWTMSHLVPLLHSEIGDQLRVIILFRHPAAVAASLALQGAYREYQGANWAITPFHDNARYAQYGPVWSKLTPYEKALYRWLEIMAYSEEIQERFPDLEYLTIRSEELFSNQESLEEVFQFCGFDPGREVVRSKLRNEKQVWNLERRPIRSEWKQSRRFPELNEIAETNGYDLSNRHVQEMIKRYQLPSGVIPFLRYHTGYWKWRGKLGGMLRSK